MIHGMIERSKMRTLTMPIASAIPSTNASARPTSALEAVTAAW
jgi:hypothetical protein